MCTYAPGCSQPLQPPCFAHLVCVQNGITPLHAASENGHTEVVKELLSCGADVGQADRVGVCCSCFVAGHEAMCLAV